MATAVGASCRDVRLPWYWALVVTRIEVFLFSRLAEYGFRRFFLFFVFLDLTAELAFFFLQNQNQIRAANAPVRHKGADFR